jgi:hypothetical protein
VTTLVGSELIVRIDPVGCTHGFLWIARDCNIGFVVVARSHFQIHSAILDTVGLEELRGPRGGGGGRSLPAR